MVFRLIFSNFAARETLPPHVSSARRMVVNSTCSRLSKAEEVGTGASCTRHRSLESAAVYPELDEVGPELGDSAEVELACNVDTVAGRGIANSSRKSSDKCAEVISLHSLAMIAAVFRTLFS